MAVIQMLSVRRDGRRLAVAADDKLRRPERLGCRVAPHHVYATFRKHGAVVEFEPIGRNVRGVDVLPGGHYAGQDVCRVGRFGESASRVTRRDLERHRRLAGMVERHPVRADLRVHRHHAGLVARDAVHRGAPGHRAVLERASIECHPVTPRADRRQPVEVAGRVHAGHAVVDGRGEAVHRAEVLERRVIDPLRVIDRPLIVPEQQLSVAAYERLVGEPLIALDRHRLRIAEARSRRHRLRWSRRD